MGSVICCKDDTWMSHVRPSHDAWLFLVVLLLAFNIPYIPAIQVAIKRSTVGCDWLLLF